MGIKARLTRLERALVPALPEGHLWVACVDTAGQVQDEGSAVYRPWLGRHARELPRPVTLVGGIDLRVVVGDAPGMECCGMSQR